MPVRPMISDLETLTRGPRILCIDLERIPGTVTLDVFDAKQRSDYIHASTWSTYPSTICAAWRWLGEKRTHFAATWTTDTLAETTWNLYNEATHVITFNGRRADNKWCRDDWLYAGLPEPAGWKDIDLYVIGSQQFALEAKSLDFMCARLGVVGKRGHYSVAIARAAAGGDVRAQRAIERYNRGDVAATLAVFDKLRPLAKLPGVNLGLFFDDDAHRCSKCGSPLLDAEGWTSTGQTRWAQYRCRECRGLSRSASRKQSSTMRGI